MSKAFTKESDDGADETAFAPRESRLPPGAANYITPGGARRLRAELERLVHTARPAASQRIASTESAGGAGARHALLEIDRRIRELRASLETAEVVDHAAAATDRARFGGRVTVRHEDGSERRYRIVGADEADSSQGWIAYVAPLAKALLGARAGDVVTLRSPRGDEELEVLGVHTDRDDD